MHRDIICSCRDLRSDLQASSARAEVLAQQRLRRCRRRAAASPGVRLRLSSFSTSRSADRPLSCRRPDWKHMAASQITGDHNSLDEFTHDITSTPHACSEFFCPHFVLNSFLIYGNSDLKFLLSDGDKNLVDALKLSVFCSSTKEYLTQHFMKTEQPTFRIATKSTYTYN